MTDRQNTVETEAENEVFPVEPRYHPIHRVPRLIYDFLASAKLAMVLLVVILACCVAGVTLWRGLDAGRVIFGTLWFNSILVLLVVNVACCFFGRIWGRRLTIISTGMILFHLSFVVILLSIVYNSLFYFRGIIRVTEGETVASHDPLSYDLLAKGRFFNMARLRGETTLLKMHTGYTVKGEDKRAAYEVTVGEADSKTHGFIYITHKLTHRGVDYFNDKEGYSLMLMLSDKQGIDQYGVHVPLQSNVLGRDNVVYMTGYTDKGQVKRGAIPFPVPPETPLFAVKAEFLPSKNQERAGNVQFTVYPLDKDGQPVDSKPLTEGLYAVGIPMATGEYLLSAREVRYWVGMLVRYEPGKPILLASLWVGLGGLILTTLGRMMRSRESRRP